MISVAIDGPAGAGKSTVAKEVARKKGFIYVDTGAMYRAMALYMLREGVDLDKPDAIVEACVRPKIDIRYEGGEQCVYLNGENVTGLIRTGEVSRAASKSSAVRQVRERLVAMQQEIARENSVVMDGRDIGTKVLPDAPVKIYLTASAEVRAKRRYEENLAKGMEADLKQIEEEIRLRDEQDMTRKESPLTKAEGAVEIDTDQMTAKEVSEEIIRLIDSQ